MSKMVTFQRWSKGRLHAIFLREGKMVVDIEIHASSVVAAAANGDNPSMEFYLPQDIACEALAARGNNIIHVNFTR